MSGMSTDELLSGLYKERPRRTICRTLIYDPCELEHREIGREELIEVLNEIKEGDINGISLRVNKDRHISRADLKSIFQLAILGRTISPIEPPFERPEIAALRKALKDAAFERSELTFSNLEKAARNLLEAK